MRREGHELLQLTANRLAVIDVSAPMTEAAICDRTVLSFYTLQLPKWRKEEDSSEASSGNVLKRRKDCSAEEEALQHHHGRTLSSTGEALITKARG